MPALPVPRCRWFPGCIAHVACPCRGARGSRAALPTLLGPLSRCPRFLGHSIIEGARRKARETQECRARGSRAKVAAVPGPLSRFTQFSGHSFIHSFTGHGRSRGSAVATVAVPKVTAPGLRGAKAGARRETWRPGVAGRAGAQHRRQWRP